MLHFWATWCDACRDEFPRIRRLLNALPARHIGVLLVSIDRPEKIDLVERDLRRYGVARLPSVILDAPDPEPVAKAVGEPRWDGTLPSTFVFDSRGKLRKSFLGRLTGRSERERVPGTLATNVIALERGADIFRVHDVAAARDALDVAAATLSGGWKPANP